MMNRVREDSAPIIITRQKAKPVVLMSLEDYSSIEETAYLLRSQANADRLRTSIANAKSGKLQEHVLLEE